MNSEKEQIKTRIIPSNFSYGFVFLGKSYDGPTIISAVILTAFCALIATMLTRQILHLSLGLSIGIIGAGSATVCFLSLEGIADENPFSYLLTLARFYLNRRIITSAAQKEPAAKEHLFKQIARKIRTIAKKERRPADETMS